MQDLNVTFVQTDLVWEEKSRNLDNFTRLIKEHPEKSDVIVLPEMFTTGFTMEAASLAEKMDGPSIKWLQQTAEQKNADMVASLIIEEDGKYFNRLIWMRPDGSYETYDKRHLFRMAGEHKFYSPGNKRLIVDCKGWRICPLVCYDLRFPVWSRNRGDLDAIFYIANWPEPRRVHWQILLRARAIENQAYVVGVNRIGKDGKGNIYTGDTAAIDPAGNVISRTLPDENHVETVLFSNKFLKDLREKFQFGLDSDRFEVK